MTLVSALRKLSCFAALVSAPFAVVAWYAPASEAAAPSLAAASTAAKLPSPKSPAAAGSLHAEIDRLLAADTLVPKMQPAADAEFLRRATLDLWGIIPTADEARAFLADKSADKRTRLIDRLLASPRFARHMATTFDVMLNERAAEKNIPFGQWYDYLYQSFLTNKPYDQMVREILVGDEANRPTTRFYHARVCEPDALTRDVGRLFMGMDMQCNQCHDHPTIDDYKIADYYGLRAFVSRTYVFNNRNNKLSEIAEKAEGETSYTSVFTGESADKVPPRLPRGSILPAEPTFKKGDELVAKPAKGERPIPKYSRRTLLAEQAAADGYEMVDRNIVNRLWAHVFGRGLVHPVEYHHPDNPPSHPAVLALLERDFRKHDCDIKRTLRELMLTDAYGRTCELPTAAQLDRTAVAKRLQACERELADLQKQLVAADKKATELLKAEPALREAALAEVRRLKTLSNAKAKSLEEAQLADECLKLVGTDAKLGGQKWSALVDFWSERADVPRLRGLPPEAFADSLMQAAGIVATVEAKARAQIKKSPPKEMKEATGEERNAIEAILVDKQTFEPLRTNFTQFVNLYAEAPGQDFGATVNQALFFGNGGVVERWLNPEGSNLTARLVAMTDSGKLAEEMYLSVLTRPATDSERKEVAAYLQGRTDRVAAVQEMVWALMSSSEFRFNH